MAWVPSQANAGFPGRFYLMFINHDVSSSEDKNRMVKMMMSYVKVTKTGAGEIQKVEKVGLLSPFDNTWLYGFGIDLLFEPGIDSNLRAVFARASDNAEVSKTLWFRPKADGINDFTYINYNDWEVLRIGLCRYVVNPGGLVANPIKCPDE